jgi:hypothetical protein
MRHGLLTFVLTLLTSLCFGQETKQYVTNFTLRDRVKKDTLVDHDLKMTFILDSTRIYISALDHADNLVWRTDPWTDNKLDEYRVRRPVIVFYQFRKNEHTYGKEKIWITYSNTQFGTVDKLTGKFRWLGQD